MEGVVERTTVKLGPHYIHEGERRGQSSETIPRQETFEDWGRVTCVGLLM